MNPYHDSKTGRFTTKGGATYLRKGTRLNSVSGQYLSSKAYQNNGRWMYTYRDDEEWDNKVYKGPFSKYLILYRGAKFIKEHEYVTIKDLKMPSQEERIEEFKKLNRKNLIKDLEDTQNMLISQQVGNDKEREEYATVDLKNLKTSDDWRIAYSIFSHAMEASWNHKSTREYCRKISKNFDAMVDDNNKGVYNNAVDPIIIFRANKVLKAVSNKPLSNFITRDDVIKNTEEVRKEVAKLGKAVML